MKKRIWHQLKKAAVVTVLAGLMGNLTVSASEFDTKESVVAEVLLQQSAQWTDPENFQAELLLEVSGLKKLYRNMQEDKTVSAEQKNDGNPADAAHPEENDLSYENVWPEENELSDGNIKEDVNDWSDKNARQGETPEPDDDKAEKDETARYFLTAYISEYFQVEESGLKYDMQAESVHIQNQKGKETEITKLTCEVQFTDDEKDTFSLRIPVTLREEYRISPVSVSYPVCQDEPLEKDQDSPNSTGVYFISRTGDSDEVLAVSPSASLEVAAAKTGITAVLKQSISEVRAGQSVPYVLEVRNTGELSLENIVISSTFSINDVKAEWESDTGFTVNGLQGVLTALQPGETRMLRATAQLTENQSGKLIHTVTVKSKHPGKDEEIGCQTSTEIRVSQLKAAFEVEKTADRTQAYPGDTITYQICIRNTGERTLHSVLSTERFQNAGIQAKFVSKEGITLSSNGTQALIPQIAPGEVVALYATVTIPQYFASQELINEVTVISDETGTQTKKSRSNVALTGNENIMTVTPGPTAVATQTYGDGYGYASKTANAYATASKPRTGDETETMLYIVLGIFAVMSGIGAFVHRNGR